VIISFKRITALFLVLILAITSLGLVYIIWSRTLCTNIQISVDEASVDTGPVSVCNFGSADFSIVTIDLFLWLFHYMVRTVFPHSKIGTFPSSQ